MSATQANSNLKITTALGEDKVLVEAVTITEQLGRLFSMEVTLKSDDPDIAFEKIVGTNVTIRLKLNNRKTRFFNGNVSRFVQSETNPQGNRYRATLVPWLWFLTRTSDCRIFQNKTVPEMIKEIFRDHGFTDFKDRLHGHYGPWENCVQYRETDFNFVSRLMEHEGIYYFFEHENGKHHLVLADSAGSHQPYPDYDQIQYLPARGGVREKEYISSWVLEQEVQPGSYATTDFNFQKPKTSLATKSDKPREHANAKFEVFDYPGEYEEHADGADYSNIRIEELQAQHETTHGQSDVRGIAVGCTFHLSGALRRDQNRQYLVTSATYHLAGEDYGSGGKGGNHYACNFTALGATQPFRTPRITPKPLIQGPQTAIVVGPKGEEIHTDEHARVRVQFHWDRHGKSDENSSCWVRVSQPGTAGKGWGAFNIPRIGHEVIVEFLEGDPDLPIITGHVYNADTSVKHGLPSNKTQTGLISRSSPGGSAANFNELRFEDKKGEEHLHMQAEKDMTSLIKNDETRNIGNDHKLTVTRDMHTAVNHNNALTVQQDHTVTVTAGNQKIEIQAGTQTVTVVGAISIKSDASITLEVGGSKLVIGPASIRLDSPRIDLNP